MSNDAMEKRLDKLEEGFHQLVVSNVKTTVLLEEVSGWVKTERNNSSRITVLENNWKWAKGILTILIMPILLLLFKVFILP